MSLRVIYRMPFDMTEDDACPRCVSIARIWQTDRNEYQRLVCERHERWAERDRRRFNTGWDELERQARYSQKIGTRPRTATTRGTSPRSLGKTRNSAA